MTVACGYGELGLCTETQRQRERERERVRKGKGKVWYITRERRKTIPYTYHPYIK